ncbi:MAG: zinc-ribbon domain-containing protein [Chloroflexi bacterium]|nr:zinc-ribbon domain-containing protein [Chloroflexota bacterium]
MPIIIFGTKNRIVPDGTNSTKTTSCGYCQQIVALEPVRQKRYFSLFFVPIIPLEKGEAAWRCPNCKKLFLRRE